jgi:hypothetical protein
LFFSYYVNSVNVLAFTPSNGPVSGDIDLTISLTNLPLTSSVLGSLKCRLQASFASDSSSGGSYIFAANVGILPDTLCCRTPSVARAGVYEISVALNGQQFSSSASSFRIYTLPTFAAFVERGTAVTGGGALSVLGYFLITPVVSVMFKRGDGVTCFSSGAAVARGERSQLTAPIPAVAAELFPAGGDVTLSVSFNGQQYHSLGVTFNLWNPARAPIVRTVRPASGPKEGGVAVVVGGDNFADVAMLSCIMLGAAGIQRVPAQFLSSQRASCVIPPNIDSQGNAAYIGGDMPISISNGDLGQGDLTSWLSSFRYTETVASVCTASGPGVDASSVVAGTISTFVITAFALLASGQSIRRESGGDVFYVDIEGSKASVGRSLVVDLDRNFQSFGSLDNTSFSDHEFTMHTSTIVPELGTYAALWQATAAGQYSISVRSAGQHIADSPFQTSVIAGSVEIYNSIVYPSTGIVEAGQDAIAVLQFRDVFGNNCTGVLLETVGIAAARLARCLTTTPACANSSVVSIPSKREIARDRWQFVFGVRRVGAYRIRVQVGAASTEIDLNGGIQVVVAAPTDASSVRFLQTAGADNSLTAGIAQRNTLQSRDRFGNPRTVGGDVFLISMYHQTFGTAASILVEDLGTGTYFVTSLATLSGQYSMSIMLGDVHISPSPLSRVMAAGPIHLPRVFVNFLPKALAGAAVDFEIVGYDTFGNPRPHSDGTYKVSLHQPSSIASALTFFSNHISAGRHVVYDVLATIAGLYDVTVVLEPSSELVRQTVLIIESAATSTATSTAYGAGLTHPLAASATEFRIQLRDMYGNKRETGGEGRLLSVTFYVDARLPPVWFSQPGLSPWSIEPLNDQGRGVYVCRYHFIPHMAFNVAVRFSTAHVQNSPLQVKTMPRQSPRMTRAKFEDSLVRISVEFDAETNTARMGTSSNCEHLFNSHFVGLLGTQASCSWTSLTLLTISLGFGATITTTKAARLRPEPSWADMWDFQLSIKNDTQLLNYWENSARSGGTIDILPPDLALLPTAVVQAPERVGICESMLVDARGSYGGGPRPLTFKWTALSQQEQPLPSLSVTLAEHIATLQSAFFVLRNSSTVAGREYRFRVDVTNFLRQSSSAEVSIRKMDISIPNVALVGASHKEIARGDALVVSALASLPNAECVSPDWRVLLFGWSLLGGPVDGPDQIELATRDLFIPSQTLHAYYTYSLKVTSWLQLQPRAKNTAQASVYITPEPLLAVIAGGNRVEGTDNEVILDGSTSIDPSAVLGFPMLYQWSCSMQYPEHVRQTLGFADGPCVSNRNQFLNFTSEAVQIIPKDFLYGSQKGLTYRFSLRINKVSNVSGVSDSRDAESYVELYLVPGQPPKVEIAGIAQAKVNADSRLVLHGQIESRVPWTLRKPTWYVMEGALDLDDSSVTTTGRHSNNLVVNAYQLVPGQHVTLRLTSEDANGASYAEVSFMVNTAPTSGNFVAEPPNGTALNSTFTLSVSQWADDASDQPLMYRFAYVDGDSEVLINDYSQAQQVEVLLPPGPVGDGPSNSTGEQHQVKLVAYIADRFGAAIRRMTSVLVFPPQVNTADHLGSFAEDVLDNVVGSFIDIGDTRRAAVAVAATLTLVNSANVTSHSNPLRRRLQHNVSTENSIPLRDRLVQSMVQIANLSAQTPTFVDFFLGMSAAATTTTDVPLSTDSSQISLSFVSSVLNSTASLSTGTGSSAVQALSNVLSSVASTKRQEEEAPMGEDLPSIRRTTVLRPVAANDSVCSHGCYGRGECIGSHCACDAHGCVQGRCFRRSFMREPDVCYLKEDECTDSYCFTYICEPGWCEPGDATCQEGQCVPTADGQLSDCYRGRCGIDDSFFASPDCEMTEQRFQSIQLEDRRRAKCNAATFGNSIDSLSSSILSSRVSGEASVSYGTSMLQVQTFKSAGDEAVSFDMASCGDSTASDQTAFVLPTSINYSACTNDEAVGTEAVTATVWGDNIFDYDDGDATLTSRVTSLTISGCSARDMEHPFLIALPTAGSLSDHASNNSVCVEDSDCFFPNGVCHNSTCVCSLPFYGKRCTKRAECKYWSVEAEMWKTDGCRVANVTDKITTCACTHLTDFGAFADECVLCPPACV